MPDPLAIKDIYSENRLFSQRVVLAFGVVIVLLGVLTWRFFSLQILEHDSYVTASDRNRVLVRSVPPKRGLVFDRQGRLLAENVPSYSLTVVPERVDDMPAMLDRLRSLIDLTDHDINRFETRLRRHRPFQAVPLRFKLTEEEIARIAAERYALPGVEVEAQLVRHYPEKALLAHVLGYVGRINSEEQRQLDPVNYAGTHHVGKTGLEKFYEANLHGQVGYEHVEVNARGRALRVLEQTDPRPGVDLHLFLDAELQRLAHEALGEERGAVVAIEPDTGGIVVFASTPAYDPNLFIRGISREAFSRLSQSPGRPFFNRALQGEYPPGSTLKPITALAGLEYGMVTPLSTIDDPGYYQLPNDDRLYRDWKRGGHGQDIDLKTAVTESCDIYFYDLAYRLTIDRMHAFYRHFGLGWKTGVDLVNEQPGLLPSREWKRTQRHAPWYPGETLNVGIGQGYLLTTPLQLAVATATVAARGQRVVPRLVRALDEHRLPAQVADTVPVDEPGYWDVIHEAMVAVVHSSRGTARGINPGLTYRIAGKTGTAQVVGISQDEDESDPRELAKRHRDHALFVGFAPAENPRLAVAVIVENGEHGSSVAAPIARQILDAYLLGKRGPAVRVDTQEGE